MIGGSRSSPTTVRAITVMRSPVTLHPLLDGMCTSALVKLAAASGAIGTSAARLSLANTRHLLCRACWHGLRAWM
jgi:hypothetical protein